MTIMLLRGNYVAPVWRDIRQDPEIAPSQLAMIAEPHGCRIQHYFFSLDRFDFYSFVEGPSLEVLTALRQLLMAQGWFGTLEGEFLVTPDVMLPILQKMQATTGQA